MGYWNSTDKTCEGCNKKFKPAYGVNQVYCSKACKQKAYRRRCNARYVPDRERNAIAVTLNQVESNII